MLNWLNPVQRCCCTAPGTQVPLAKATAKAYDNNDDGPEEIDLDEEQDCGDMAGAPVEVCINSARERAGFRHAPPAGPGKREIPTFLTSEVHQFQGKAVHSGKILLLCISEAIHEVILSVYANGFCLDPVDPSAPGSPGRVARAWSPFSLVEKCQVFLNPKVRTLANAAFWAVFKLTVFRKDGQDRCYYFAVTGTDAHKERDRWAQELIRAIGNVTVSLFPRREITVEPLPENAATSTRLMAGYLLQAGVGDSISLFYCELHVFSQGTARLAIYQDEWCEQEVTSLHLAETSTVSTRKGVHCTIFGIDSYRFCARTTEEKELWVRAVSNIKVKLMFDAPDPSKEELRVFRSAIHERLGQLGEADWISEGPLLARVPRKAPGSPRGDAWEPDSSVGPSEDEESVGGAESIEDIDEPWESVAPPPTEAAFCATPKAGAEDVHVLHASEDSPHELVREASSALPLHAPSVTPVPSAAGRASSETPSPLPWETAKLRRQCGNEQVCLVQCECECNVHASLAESRLQGPAMANDSRDARPGAELASMEPSCAMHVAQRSSARPLPL